MWGTGGILAGITSSAPSVRGSAGLREGINVDCRIQQDWRANRRHAIDPAGDKIDGVKDSVINLALNVEKSFAALNIARAVDRVCWLLMSGALLGIMARAFKWI
jgi:hypothetical protein